MLPTRRSTRSWSSSPASTSRLGAIREKSWGSRFFDPAGVAVVAEAEVDGQWVLVGGALAAPLERTSGVDGADHDAFRPLNNTIYALSTTLDPDYRGYRLGQRMKREVIEAAAALKRTDGTPRYHFFSGRMRVGATPAMRRINAHLGATMVDTYGGQYGGEGSAIYYRMPLRTPIAIGDATDPFERVAEHGDVTVPLQEAPATLRQLYDRGALYGPAVHKLTLVNYVTPSVVRALEHITALTPAHPHVFLTSSRDETFDKSLRILRHHRPDSTTAVAFEGGYVGHTSAAARSLSDPRVHTQGPVYFDHFVRVPHPADGVDEALEALRGLISAQGAESLFGLWAEPVQERTGKVVPDVFWDALRAFDLPVVSVETASAMYRSGRGAFHGAASLVPDLVAWYAGGQIGFVHVSDRYYVPKPLTMVSTWDGDELSLVRTHHRLRTLRELHSIGIGEVIEGLQSALDPLGVDVFGVGAMRVAHVGAKAAPLAKALLARGHRVSAFPNGVVLFAPALDIESEGMASLAESLAQCWSELQENA